MKQLFLWPDRNSLVPFSYSFLRSFFFIRNTSITNGFCQIYDRTLPILIKNYTKKNKKIASPETLFDYKISKQQNNWNKNYLIKYCEKWFRNTAKSKCFITYIKGNFSFNKNLKSLKPLQTFWIKNKTLTMHSLYSNTIPVNQQNTAT